MLNSDIKQWDSENLTPREFKETFAIEEINKKLSCSGISQKTVITRSTFSSVSQHLILETQSILHLYN